MPYTIETTNNIYQQIQKHYDIHIFNSTIEVKNLENIIKDILREFCKVSVIGYNRIENCYWCKIEENKKCILYSQIKIVSNDSYSSIIIIIDESDLHFNFHGAYNNYKNIKNDFLETIEEGLYLYQNSAFVRYFL
jgi:hypothetical protein